MLSFAILRSTIPIGVAYFVTSALCVSLTRFDGGIAFLWVSSAIMIAALRVRDLREWPAVAISCAAASILATGCFGLGWPYAIAFAIINVSEGLVGAEMLRRARRRNSSLGSLGWMLELIIPIGIIAPGIATSLLVVTTQMAGTATTISAVTFFCGHALGNLAFTPLTRIIARDGFASLWRELSRHGAREPAALLSATLLIAVLVFSQERLPLLFLPILPLVLVAFRLGFAGSALGLMIVTVTGGVLTLLGHGPVQLFRSEIGEQIQFLQLYLASITLTLLPVAADLQKKQALHGELKVSEARYRMLADHSTDVLMHLDLAARIRYISPSIARLTGHEASEFSGGDRTVIAVTEDMPLVIAGHRAVIEAAGEMVSFEFRLPTSDGGSRWVEANARLIVGDDGAIEGVMSILRDISARKETEERLSHAALTDTLTGLPNRRSFEQAVERRTEVDGLRGDCVAIFDIDRFKRVNDTFGHDAGDGVLQTFARVLRGVVRKDDSIARLGGEEFAVLFPATAIPIALRICDRLRTEMAATVTRVDGAEISVTVSGGVAMLGSRGIEDALKQADLALYTAKRGGRDQMALAA